MMKVTVTGTIFEINIAHYFVIGYQMYKGI